MGITFLPSQLGNGGSRLPLPYTSSPAKLLFSDIILCLSSLRYFLGVVRPVQPFRSGELDELYPSLQNLQCIAIHGFLIVYQLIFIFTLPICILIPSIGGFIYVAVVVVINQAICRVLNGKESVLVSKVNLDNQKRPEHAKEHWVFINGVAVGLVFEEIIEIFSFRHGRTR